jgi:hypothetical protein
MSFHLLPALAPSSPSSASPLPSSMSPSLEKSSFPASPGASGSFVPTRCRKADCALGLGFISGFPFFCVIFVSGLDTDLISELFSKSAL